MISNRRCVCQAFVAPTFNGQRTCGQHGITSFRDSSHHRGTWGFSTAQARPERQGLVTRMQTLEEVAVLIEECTTRHVPHRIGLSAHA